MDTWVLNKTEGSFSSGTTGTVEGGHGMKLEWTEFKPDCSDTVITVPSAHLTMLRPRTRSYDQPNRASRRAQAVKAYSILTELKAGGGN